MNQKKNYNNIKELKQKYQKIIIYKHILSYHIKFIYHEKFDNIY